MNKHDEISFEELSKELNINVDDVESFIIDGTCMIGYFAFAVHYSFNAAL